MIILIVEDEKKIASFVKGGLEEEGYAVDVAYDGEKGLNLAESNSYDLIILDIMLPKKDGLTVCKSLRKVKVTTPVLMLTAKDTVEDKVNGLDSGADDYLVKPFAFEELLARVRALLRRGRPLSPEKLLVADLILDPVTHQVKRGGKIIQLTYTEYRLLSYLMSNANRVLTRTMIEDHVWGYDYFEEFSNIIDVYIRYLRKKIDEGFNKKLIHTIRGKGYIIKEEE